MRLASVLLSFLLGIAAAQPALAQATAAGDAPAKLVLGDREVMEFKGTLFGYPPAERAEAAKQRALRAYARNPDPRLRVRVTNDGAQVIADRSVLFHVVPADVNSLAGETPESRAEAAVAQLELVLSERQARSDPKVLAEAIGLSLLVTLAWLLLLRGVVWLATRAGRWLRQAAGVTASQVRPFGVAMFDPQALREGARQLVRALAWLAAGVLTYLWLNLVLELIPHTRPLGDRLTQMLLDVLGTIGEAVLHAIPGLAFVAAIFLIARFIAGTGRAFFDRVHRQNLTIGWLDRDTAPPTAAIFSVVVWLFALAMAYPYLPGSQSQAFQGLSVLVGLMVSIGASGTVSQAASGLMLMYTRAYRVGEFVRIQDTEGTVVDVGLLSTRVRTGMGEEVMLPNTLVLSNTSRNYSRAVPGTGFVIDTVVTIGYDAPWRQVVAMLTEAARRVQSITDQPAPRVIQTALSDYYVEYRLVAYSRMEAPMPRAEALSELHANIQDVFNEHGVQIMSPHYVGDPAEPKVVPRDRWYAAPAAAPGEPRG
ncbi:MAG: mechanosensitive ion channel family protein [Arenimonas sp.]|nr:mechanosensitive ion channel family protein [Arenimonas sp.]